MLILLTNDDGVDSEGLEMIRDRLMPFGEIVICAPDRNCSASSRKLTIDRPLQFREVSDRVFAVEGTPVDCVILAFHRLLDKAPDIVLSGINLGPNLGEDVFYSGTVGAAMEARMEGVPAAAISSVSRTTAGLPYAGDICVWVTEMLLDGLVPAGVVLNVNVPKKKGTQGAKLTRLGRRKYEGHLTTLEGPAGKEVFWIGGGAAVWQDDPDTDYSAVKDGIVSVTPLGWDLTDHSALATMKTSPIHSTGRSVLGHE